MINGEKLGTNLGLVIKSLGVGILAYDISSA
jgi:hypothetical protein